MGIFLQLLPKFKLTFVLSTDPRVAATSDVDDKVMMRLCGQG